MIQRRIPSFRAAATRALAIPSARPSVDRSAAGRDRVQPHLGLLRPERGERGRRTVYADRFEVDVVMTSMFMRVNSKCARQARPPLRPDGEGLRVAKDGWRPLHTAPSFDVLMFAVIDHWRVR